MEGLRFIRRSPVLFAAISLDLFAVLFGGAVALLPVIAEERLGVGDVAYGWLRAAPGMGAAVMAVYIAARPVTRRIGPTLFVAVGVFGVATLVLGITRSYAVAFAALIVLSAADMVSVFIRSSLVPLVTPDEKRGRVLAVENVFIGASNELGAFESGVAAQAFGTPATVIGGGVGTLVVVGVWAVAFPSLRRIDRFEDLESAHAAG
jgi:MFS family permease